MTTLEELDEIVDIFKPLTSRPANSEKYIVCKNFKGISNKDKKKLISISKDMWKKAVKYDIEEVNGEYSFIKKGKYIKSIFCYFHKP